MTSLPSFRATTRVALFFLLVCAGGPAVNAQNSGEHDAYIHEANFELGARFAPYRIGDMLYSTSIFPRWIEGSQKFWYSWETSDGTFYYIVDPARGSKSEIFDRDRIAAELTRITRDPWDAQHLPIQSIKFIDSNTLQFEVQSTQDEEIEEEMNEDMEDGDQQEKKQEKPKTRKKVFHFEYDVDSQTLRELEDFEEPDNHPNWASISPDGNTVLFGRHHNIYRMSSEDYQNILDARQGKQGDEADEAEEKVEVDEIQVTTGGEEFFSYTGGGFGDTDEEKEEKKDDRMRISGSWSADSRYFAIVRSDIREVDDLWVIHSTGNKRPQLETYKYAMPGEEHVGLDLLEIHDLNSNTTTPVQADAFTDQNIGTFTARQFRYPDSDEPFRSIWLGEGSEDFYFYRISRDLKRVDVCRADAATGAVEVLIEERLNTYVETQRLDMLENGDLLWWSERDGWGHLYRFDHDGTLKNRLTEGPFSVRGIEGIDEKSGVVYFEANAREDGEDPYFQHAYRVNLDGTSLKLLDPGDFDHRSSWNEDSRFFVDSYSRVNTIPAIALHDATGKKIMDLEEADFSRLMEAGYQFPEPFTVKAADGVTDLFGVMYKPFDFDENKVYPLVEYVYPGPQTEAVSKSFSTNSTETALAQFGMIVITVGNRGGHPNRSKWYHNYGYGNLRDYGLADKKVTAEQLAYRHDYIDMDRIGIYGHSGGGFMSTAAMLVYPDFFKVAVSSSGNHTNDIYNRWWSEKHHGVEEIVSDSGDVSFKYDIDKNPDLAKNLKGHLLLTTGDIDNNVHPANTLRMVDALIKANKRFDFFMLTGQRHGYGNMNNYWFWLRAEYFVKHLIGDSRWNPDIVELNMEREQG